MKNQRTFISLWHGLRLGQTSPVLYVYSSLSTYIYIRAIHLLTRPDGKLSLNLGHVGFGFRQSRVVLPSKYPFETGHKVRLESGQVGRVKKIVVAR